MNYKHVPQVNDFWYRKIKFYFNEILDVNSDGVINYLDIELFRNLYCQMKHLTADSPAVATFSEFLETWFMTMKDSSDIHSKDITLEVYPNNLTFLYRLI
jgi:hypothetical protein